MSVDWQIVKAILWSYFKANGPVRFGQLNAYLRGKKPSRADLIPNLAVYANLIVSTGYGSYLVGSRIATSQNPTTYLSGLLNLAFLFVFIITLLSFGPAMAASSPLTAGDTETLMACPVNEETLLVGKVLTFLTMANPYSIPAFLGAFIGLALSGLASPAILLMGPLLYHLVVLSASWISSSTNFYLLKRSSKGTVKAFWITVFAAILVTALSTVLRTGLDIGRVLRMFSHPAENQWLLLLPSTHAAQAVIYSCADVQLLPGITYLMVMMGVFSLSWLLALRSVRGIFFKTISEAHIGFAERRRTFGYAAFKEISIPKVFESLSGRLLPEGARIAIFLERRFSFRGALFLGKIIPPLLLYVIFLLVLTSVPPIPRPFLVLMLIGLAGFEAILLGMPSATAISQEGKNIWVVLSSPVRLEEYLIGKCYLYLLLNSAIQFAMVFITAILVKLSLAEALLLSSASVFLVFAVTGVGQWISARYATFESYELNIASQSIQVGGTIPITGGILLFLTSSLIMGVNLLLPATIILLVKNTFTALLAGLPYSIIVNLALFNLFIRRAGRTLAKREYLVTA